MASKTVPKICLIETCDKPSSRQSRCENHYRQFRRSSLYSPVHNRGEGESATARFWSKVDKTTASGCWIWQAGVSAGYGQTYINSKAIKAHRAAWYYTFGVMPSHNLLHSCDTPLCVNPSHLREGTNADNVRDKVARDRQARGIGSNRTILTDEDVRTIRREFRPRVVTQNQLAATFGVCSRTILDILKRRTWRHID